MNSRSMAEVLTEIGNSRLELLDEILRGGHATYNRTPVDLRLEHDVRAQASATYSHIVAEAERQFENDRSVHPMEINGLKLWILEDAQVVISFKKMSKTGAVRRHDSNQQKRFDLQLPLEGLPDSPTRLRVGYLLDSLSTNYVRTQIAAPNGKNIQWCVGIHAPEDRASTSDAWYDIAEQNRLAL